MRFRIGINLGDVIVEDQRLYGDGVNIAARLEGLAEVGGICVSRAVHEQVANKLSVQFADIGEQEVKNIPNPVHAYMVAMRREDGSYSKPQLKKPAKAQAAPNWMWPAAVTVVSLAAIGVGGFLYFTKLEMAPTPRGPMTASSSAPSPSPPAAVPAPGPTVAAPAPSPRPPSPPPTASGEKLATAAIPFVSERTRATLANEYVPAADFKAFALNVGGFNAYVTAQPSEEAAKSAAVEQCQKRADSAQSPRKCELYAVGDTVVYLRGKPPLPPQPWVRRDPATERPFVAENVPLTRDAAKTRLENTYVTGRKTKSLALAPGGQYFITLGVETADEAVRRSLESCGGIAGVACMIVAVDDAFVVAMPTTMKVTGFFKAAGNSVIASDARDDVARKFAEATAGWNAIAVGAAGRPGLALRASSEQAAVNQALANCVKSDSDCHVIAIGPFAVGPN